MIVKHLVSNLVISKHQICHHRSDVIASNRNVVIRLNPSLHHVISKVLQSFISNTKETTSINNISHSFPIHLNRSCMSTLIDYAFASTFSHLYAFAAYTKSAILNWNRENAIPFPIKINYKDETP